MIIIQFCWSKINQRENQHIPVEAFYFFCTTLIVNLVDNQHLWTYSVNHPISVEWQFHVVELKAYEPTV